jgi:hypothetical protein
MYQDDPLEPEGGYAPSHYQGKDLDSASCPEEFTIIPCNQEGPPMRTLDPSKIQTLEDIIAIFTALRIQCTQDIVDDYNLGHLMKD